MRHAIKHGFYKLQRNIGRAITPIVFEPHRRTRRLPIFLLHAISGAVSDMAVRPARFREQLAALSGCQCLSFQDALAALQAPDIPPAYVLTFDDGYTSVLDSGLPLLEEFNARAILFVTVNFIERKVAPPWHSSHPALLHEYASNAEHFQPMSWAQLKELAVSGRFEIGSHTVNHHMMGNLPRDQVRDELLRSRQILEDRLGIPVRYFSYPYGVRRYGAYSEETEAVLRDTGYESSCTSEIGRAAMGSSPFLLPRIPLEDADMGVDARAKAAGVYDWVAVAQKAYQNIFSNPH